MFLSCNALSTVKSKVPGGEIHSNIIKLNYTIAKRTGGSWYIAIIYDKDT